MKSVSSVVRLQQAINMCPTFESLHLFKPQTFSAPYVFAYTALFNNNGYQLPQNADIVKYTSVEPYWLNFTNIYILL